MCTVMVEFIAPELGKVIVGELVTPYAINDNGSLDTLGRPGDPMDLTIMSSPDRVNFIFHLVSLDNVLRAEEIHVV
jgi:hypothetical protein